MNNQRVLVTGGSGYVATYCLLELLKQGYQVRTTVRSLARADEVKAALLEGGVTKLDNLEFVEADLLSDHNWDVAVRGCDYVLHVASPLQLAHPKHEDDMIRPAVEGTQRVLRAARDGGVRRVVLTSNFGAVGYSHRGGGVITEESWTDPDEPGLSPYNKSKVLAEKAAWQFLESEGGKLELSVVNAVAVLGPATGPKLSGGHSMVLSVLNGTLRSAPRIELAVVDVRDLADLHLLAMTKPEASGQRFLALSSGTTSLLEIAQFVRNQRPGLAPNAASKLLSDWLLRAAALFDARAKGLLSLVGVNRKASNEKARTLLGWKPRPSEEVVLATADALRRYGYL